MTVERTTPQLVKKGKGKKRPGYRGPGEYQGGRGYGGSKSSKGGDKGTGGSKGNLGGGGGGQDSNYRRYSPPTKKTYTSKTIDSKPVTGKDYKDSKNNFINILNKNNKIAAAQAGTKFTPYQGGARNTSYYKPNPLSGLLKLAAGFAFPGAGFLLNQGGKFKEGLMGLNDSIQNSDFGRSTSLMDYLDMKKFGGFDEREMARRINMDEAKNLQARIDGGEFGGFGIQKPTQTFNFDNSGIKTKSNFSNPFANTVGTTANTTNDAVSSNSIPTVNGVPMIDTGSVYQDNLNFFDNLNKGIVVNNEPPMVNTDNVMQGSVLDAKPKKGIMQMISDAYISPAGAAETVPTTEDITIDGGMLNSPFMETQIGPRIIAAENAYYNKDKMPPEFLGDRIRMNMELGNARGFMGPGFADGGLASMFTRRG